MIVNAVVFVDVWTDDGFVCTYLLGAGYLVDGLGAAVRYEGGIGGVIDDDRPV